MQATTIIGSIIYEVQALNGAGHSDASEVYIMVNRLLDKKSNTNKLLISNSRPESSVLARAACSIAFANTHKAIHGALDVRPARRRFAKAIEQAALAG